MQNQAGFFSGLYEFMSTTADLNFTVRKTTTGLAVALIPNLKAKGVEKVVGKIRPMLISKPADELDRNFLTELQRSASATNDLSSNADQYVKSVQSAAKAIKKKAAEKGTSSTGNRNEALEKYEAEKQKREERKTSPLDDAHKQQLLINDDSTEDFKTALNESSVETLKAAWTMADSSKRKLIEQELCRVTGKSVKDLDLNDQMALF